MAQTDKTYGDRMRLARIEAGFRSVDKFVSAINAHLEVQEVAAIAVSTYRKWELIGTPREDKKLKSYPHPVFFPVFSGLTGVTAYWVWYGETNGIVKRIADLPMHQRRVIDQQLASIQCPRKLGLIEEFTRVVSRHTHEQQEALRAFLKLF